MKLKSLSAAIVLLVAGSLGIASASFSQTGSGADGKLVAAKGRRNSVAPSTVKLKGKIEREIVMADDLMLKGRYSDAADLYKQVMAKNPKSVPALVGYGMALAKQFKLDASRDQFDKALALDPQNAMAHSGKAMVLFNSLQSSSGSVMKNRATILSSAEAECKQGLAIDSGMPEAHYTLGMIYKDQGRIDEAVNEFNEAVKLDPQYSEAYSGLGVAKLQQGDTAGATAAFKQAVSLNTGNSTGHYGLGTVICSARHVRRRDQRAEHLSLSVSKQRSGTPFTRPSLCRTGQHCRGYSAVPGVDPYQTGKSASLSGHG